MIVRQQFTAGTYEIILKNNEPVFTVIEPQEKISHAAKKKAEILNACLVVQKKILACRIEKMKIMKKYLLDLQGIQNSYTSLKKTIQEHCQKKSVSPVS